MGYKAFTKGESEMRRKLTGLVVSLMLLLPLLVACGGTQATGTGANATASGAGGADTTAAAGGAAEATPAAGSGDKTITVGSKDFTEAVVMGEMYAQALEANGYTVNRKLRLGSVQILDQALMSGQIDMYPEYTGTSLETVVKYTGETPKSPDETYQIVKDFYAKRSPALTVLQPANFNNTNGIVVRKEVAQKYNLKTLEDLAKASPNLIFASFSEFQERTDSFPRIKENYPETNFKDVLLVNAIGLRYKSLEEGKADVGIGFTTDGQIASQDLVVMEDPKNIWPFYYPAPVINTEYLQAHPDVEGILNAVSAKLDAATIQRLNALVDIDQEEPAEVAEKFLTDNGLK